VGPDAQAGRLAAARSAAARAGVDVVLKARIDARPTVPRRSPSVSSGTAAHRTRPPAPTAFIRSGLQEAEQIRGFASAMPVAAKVMVRRGHRRSGVSAISVSAA
jgi:hypothetical protein